MNKSAFKNNLTAIVSFESSLEKLSSCLQALNTWIPHLIVVPPKGTELKEEKNCEFKVSFCSERVSTTKTRWETGLDEINTPWGLFIRSNEIVTGKLRKAITEKIKTNIENHQKYPLPTTVVFLKKRLKYSIDWHDSQPSHLIRMPRKSDNIGQQENFVTFEGELIRYSEETFSDCERTVNSKSEERAARLKKSITSVKPLSIFFQGFISSVKIFIESYFLKKGFKEGFEGTVLAIFDAHAELLGYLRYYELYVRRRSHLEKLPFLKNILVIKLRDIGDNVLCTPLIRNLKQLLPHSSISVLTWSYSISVFEKNPSIDHLFGIPKNPSSLEIKKLHNKLKSMDLDLAINTHSGGLPSKILKQIEALSKINNFYRGRNKHYNIFTDESDYYRSSIERDLDCLRSLGLEPITTKTEIFLDNDEIAWAREQMKTKGLDITKKIVLIHPTAAVSIREWPLEKFYELIKMFKQEANTQPIVICASSEFPRIKTLLTDIPDLVIFHNITVRQMMAIIHECDLVIDNDSSPSHIATAFNVPAIVLFSQAIREIFRPYHQEKDQHFVFYNDVDCRECELTYCSERICLDFSPGEVYSQAAKMLSIK